jgi:alkylation response protein AidB-like acyl-CoA dehydrogenase
MVFKFSEEQKSLRALVREFCKREVPEGATATWRDLMAKRHAEPRDRVPWHWVRKLYEIGLLHLTAPEKYGGGDVDSLTALLVLEDLTRLGGALGPVVRQFYSFWGYMAAVMNEEQQDEWFPKVMENPDFTFASACSEAEAFGDIMLPYDEGGGSVMKTFAYRDGDEWVINGEKQWITGGAIADLILVHARTDKDAPVSQAASMFLVPATTPGVSVVRINDIFAPHAFANTVLNFENVRVPRRNLVGEVNKGYGFLWSGSFRYGLITAGCQLGSAQHLFEFTRDFAKTRIAGGRPIIEHGIVGPHLAVMAQNIQALRILAYYNAANLDEQYRAGFPRGIGALAFSFSGGNVIRNALVEIADAASEVLGGVGGTSEAPLEAFIAEIYGMRHALGSPSFNLWKASRLIDEYIPIGYDS